MERKQRDPGLDQFGDLTAVPGRDTWEWPHNIASLTPSSISWLHPMYMLHLLLEIKLCPLLREGRYHSYLRDLLKRQGIFL